MTRTPHSAKTTVFVAPALLLGLSAAACSQEPLAEPTQDGIVVARATSESSDPTVDAVDPDSASQDTTLDIVVTGSGYDKGSQVTLELGGVSSEKVRTNSTGFVSSRKLIANITIAADADTGAYDVAVMTTGGRKGIGIEMFAVHGKPVWSVSMRAEIPAEVRPGVANMLLPDTVGGVAGTPYDGDVCGVKALLDVGTTGYFQFYPIYNGLNTKQIRDLQRTCADFPRLAWFDLARATVHIPNPADPADHSLDQSLPDYIASGNADPIVPNPNYDPQPYPKTGAERGDDGMLRATVSGLTAVPDGATELRGNGFNLDYCLNDGIGRPFRFNAAANPGSSDLAVTRAGEVLLVRTQAFPNNVGSCEHTRSDGTVIELLLHMDLAYMVSPLP